MPRVVRRDAPLTRTLAPTLTLILSLSLTLTLILRLTPTPTPTPTPTLTLTLTRFAETRLEYSAKLKGALEVPSKVSRDVHQSSEYA